MAGYHEAVVAALDHVRAPAARRGDRAGVLPGPAVRGEIGDPVAGAARGAAGPDQDQPGAVERHAADGVLGAVIDGDRHRRPVRPAVGAQPDAGSAVGDHRGGPVRGGEVDALRGSPGLLQPQLRGRQPLPGHAVTRGPDHRLVPGAGRLVAGGQEAVRRVGDHVDRVTGLPRGDSAGSRQRPGLPILAGPDGVVAERHPSARAAGDPDGLIAQRGLAAAGQLDRGQPPGAPGVGRHEELLADGVAGLLRARRHHRVPRGDDAVDRLEDAARQLSRIGRQGVRRDRGCCSRASLVRARAFLRRVPRQDGEDHGGRDGRGSQGRHAYRAGPPARPAPAAPARAGASGRRARTRAPGGTGARRGGLEQQRAVRPAAPPAARTAGVRPGLLPGPRQDRLGRRVLDAARMTPSRCWSAGREADGRSAAGPGPWPGRPRPAAAADRGRRRCPGRRA